MNIKLHKDMCEEVTATTLKSTIEDIENMLTANWANENDVHDGPFVPFFSYDYIEEKKELKKQLKSFVKVHNWYVLTEEKSKL